jgi:putative ABC transport system substrate-binding protein
MNRRDFLVTLLAAVMAAPPGAGAQPGGPVRRIGFLQSARNENFTALIESFRDLGYSEERGARIEARLYREAPDRLPRLAAELITLKCDVIVAGSPYAIRAILKATNTIPVVGIDLESDPVANGWAASLARPGGNLTGLFLDLPELGGKQIELLKELVPRLSRIAAVWDSSIGGTQFRAIEAAGQAVGVSVQSLPVQGPRDLEEAFVLAKRQHAQGVIVPSWPLGQDLPAKLAREHRLPAIGLVAAFPRSGGLIAYGPDVPGMFRRGLAISPSLLSRADRVID